MPRLTTYGINSKIVKKVCCPLADDLAHLLGIPREYIAFRVNQDLFIQDGEEVQGDPFVEVCLFDRGQEKEDEIAKIVTKHFRAQGCEAIDVYLTRLERRRYFENGEHF